MQIQPTALKLTKANVYIPAEVAQKYKHKYTYAPAPCTCS